MPKITLFAEDFGHEEVITALVNRIASEHDIIVKIKPRNVRGGHGKAISELKFYLHDLKKGKDSLPDLLVIAIDANCNGFSKRRKEVESVVPTEIEAFTIYAIPDPHIERWLLLDSTAFKAVLGKGCHAPDQKCERGRYKNLLLNGIREAGIMPMLGGLEHAEDIVKEMNLQYMKKVDKSLGTFLQDLENKFKEWEK